ncbi:hypothetical protein ANN_12396 [Periplaneta americana]|uniref:Uncharacterized protein n=1 Tax=Periplaneta americana TaxID=6978 RepID=A0ABQ8TIE1_PERAM|nr:hypothetical protein ANN_12396 [Periplaneta americana]
MDLREVGCDDRDWINLAQDRDQWRAYVRAGMNLRRWAGHVARTGESRNAYRVLVGRPEGKRPLGRRRRRWEDNIKMDLREVGYDDRDWINLAQDRDRWRAYVRAAMNLRFLKSHLFCLPFKTFPPRSTERDRREGEAWGESKQDGGQSRRDVLIMCYISAVSTASWCDVSANSREKAESHALAGLKVIEIPATSKSKQARLVCRSSTRVCVRICVSIRRPEFECSGPQLEGPEFECSGPQLEGPEFEYSELSMKSLMIAGNEFQSLGRAIVKEDEYEEVRWDGIVSIVSWRERVFRLWWEESLSQPIASRDGIRIPTLREVGYDGRDWTNLAQDRDQWRAYVRAAMNLRVP